MYQGKLLLRDYYMPAFSDYQTAIPNISLFVLFLHRLAAAAAAVFLGITVFIWYQCQRRKNAKWSVQQRREAEQ
jgi:NADH:ubiquinone oxidoreductase subunit K